MKQRTKEYLAGGMILFLLLWIPTLVVSSSSTVVKKEQKGAQRTFEVAVAEITPVVYQQMTMAELTNKLDASLPSTVAGKGALFASYSLEKGVDPYLAVAIMLHETGCKWGCSTLVTKCNNVGGQKGGPTCGSSGYARFSSLDEGIRRYIDNLADNYVAYGLTTPNAMQRKYVGSNNSNWASKVTNYMLELEQQ